MILNQKTLKSMFVSRESKTRNKKKQRLKEMNSAIHSHCIIVVYRSCLQNTGPYFVVRD